MTEPVPGGASAPAPAPAGAEQTYFNALQSGVWLVPRCTACRRAVFYPRALCPFCGERAFDWFEPTGFGTVHSTTVMRRAPQAGGDLHLCLVDLDEGFRMMSRVEGVAPEVPAIGDRVKAFVGEEGTQRLVLFRPVEVAA